MRLRQALEVLGNSPETIRTALADKGIQGRRMDGMHCPLAVYIQQCGFTHVVVTESYIKARGWIFTQKIRPVSNALWTFMHNFDMHQYPELVSRI